MGLALHEMVEVRELKSGTVLEMLQCVSLFLRHALLTARLDIAPYASTYLRGERLPGVVLLCWFIK